MLQVVSLAKLVSSNNSNDINNNNGNDNNNSKIIFFSLKTNAVRVIKSVFSLFSYQNKIFCNY